MKSLSALRPSATILLGVALMLSLAMGLRQSLGLFVQPAVKDLAISVADFTLAIAVQNLMWGFMQPFAGALATRVGFRPVMLGGAVLYVLGMLVLATATGFMGVLIGAGVLIGIALACCGSSMAMAVASRPVPAAQRSMVLGMVSAVGSLGALVSAPIGQSLSMGFGWRTGLAGFVVIALVVVPCAWLAGRVDKAPLPPSPLKQAGSAREALGLALGNFPFMVMATAYFVCGLQLVFLTTHLPSYLDLCGLDPMLGAQALAMIGAFNVLGSLFFGWAGGRWSKGMLLGLIYIMRSLVLAWYFGDVPSPASTLVFAGLMGFLWLGVAPLMSGAVAEIFGLRWQAMIQGVAFTSHQLGSSLGAFGGGLLFSAYGNYQLAWQLGVGMGLAAGIVQVLVGMPKWGSPGRPQAAA